MFYNRRYIDVQCLVAKSINESPGFKTGLMMRRHTSERRSDAVMLRRSKRCQPEGYAKYRYGCPFPGFIDSQSTHTHIPTDATCYTAAVAMQARPVATTAC